MVREQREGAPRIGHCRPSVLQAARTVPGRRPRRPQSSRPHRALLRSTRCGPGSAATCCPRKPRRSTDDVNNALLAGDEPKAERIARAFQDRPPLRSRRALPRPPDEKSAAACWRRSARSAPGEDAATLKCVLKGRDALTRLAAHLPLRIGNLANAQLDECKALIESTAALTASCSCTRC